MKFKVVLHYLGWILLGVGILMLLPLGWSFYYGEQDTIRAFLVSMGITLSSGLLLLLLTVGTGERLSIREALAFVTFGFVFSSAFSALPYVLTGVLPNYLDALFEAVSGYTTTGASVIVAPEAQSQGLMLWRSFTQWLGGIGVVVLFHSIFPVLGVGPAYQMESEQAGLPTERWTASVAETGRAIGWIYLGLSVSGTALLLVGGMPLFDAIATIFSAISTGGFSPRNASIGAYNSLPIEIIVMVFMIAGAINFHVYSSLVWQRRLGRFFRDVEFKMFLVILFLGSLLVPLDLFLSGEYSLGDALRYGIFQAVSIQTTSGFTTANFGLWTPFSQAVLIVAMLIGGCSGSTAGGIKVSRLIVLGKYALNELRRVFSPYTVMPIKFGERTLAEDVIARAVGVGVLYMVTFIISFLLVSVAGLDMVSAASAVAASMASVGPGLGSVTIDYTGVSAFGKLVLMMDMLLGRLELWAVLALFSPAFWKWR